MPYYIGDVHITLTHTLHDVEVEAANEDLAKVEFERIASEMDFDELANTGSWDFDVDMELDSEYDDDSEDDDIDFFDDDDDFDEDDD